jgi:hypothetical protein
MGGVMFAGGKKTTVLLITFLCIAVTLMSSTMTAATYSLSTREERMLVGGGGCSDFLNGFAVGMGVASLFGCVWCPAAAIGSKVIELFAC